MHVSKEVLLCLFELDLKGTFVLSHSAGLAKTQVQNLVESAELQDVIIQTLRDKVDGVLLGKALAVGVQDSHSVLGVLPRVGPPSHQAGNVDTENAHRLAFDQRMSSTVLLIS